MSKRPEESLKDADYILFTRENLFMMLGALAMPPTTISHTEHTDCADIASEIISKVEEYRTRFAALKYVEADPEAVVIHQP